MNYVWDHSKYYMMTPTPLELFKQEAPDVASAFDGLIQALVASKGLDEKTKQLIYIAMKTAMGDEMAIKAHLPMAKALGARREEVVDAILLTLMVSGISGVLRSLPQVVQVYGE